MLLRKKTNSLKRGTLRAQAQCGWAWVSWNFFIVFYEPRPCFVSSHSLYLPSLCCGPYRQVFRHKHLALRFYLCKNDFQQQLNVVDAPDCPCEEGIGWMGSRRYPVDFLVHHHHLVKDLFTSSPRWDLTDVGATISAMVKRPSLQKGEKSTNVH